MKTSFHLLLSSTLVSSIVLAAGAVMAADPIVIDVPRAAAPVASPLTRAQVLADLHMWRVAGLQEFSRREQLENERYREALARYQALRASPQYDELVHQLESRPSAIVVGR